MAVHRCTQVSSLMQPETPHTSTLKAVLITLHRPDHDSISLTLVRFVDQGPRSCLSCTYFWAVVHGAGCLPFRAGSAGGNWSAGERGYGMG